MKVNIDTSNRADLGAAIRLNKGMVSQTAPPTEQDKKCKDHSVWYIAEAGFVRRPFDSPKWNLIKVSVDILIVNWKQN
jgi:hypothetical protein